MEPQSQHLRNAESAQKLFGLVNRRPRWGLSWRGWLLILFLAAAGFVVFILEVQPFLAVTRRVDSKILVVEGWMHEFAIQQAAEEFKRGHYDRIFTTGGPSEGLGSYLSDADTTASVGAKRLIQGGIPAERVQMVPSRKLDRDRTYGSAVALRNWFQRQAIPARSFNVLTESAHARRTQLLFQEAFGPDFQIGIVAIRNPDYDPKHWWHYSEGVREVIAETIAYVYARFFFYPTQAERDGTAGMTIPFADFHA